MELLNKHFYSLLCCAAMFVVLAVYDGKYL